MQFQGTSRQAHVVHQMEELENRVRDEVKKNNQAGCDSRTAAKFNPLSY